MVEECSSLTLTLETKRDLSNHLSQELISRGGKDQGEGSLGEAKILTHLLFLGLTFSKC